MKRRQRLILFGATAAAVVGIGGYAVSGQQPEDNGWLDEYGVYHHDTPADIGVEAMEDTIGSAAEGGLQMPISPDETLVIPEMKGVFVSEGESGFQVILPHGTIIHLPNGTGRIEIFDLRDADVALVDQIVDSLPKRERVLMN